MLRIIAGMPADVLAIEAVGEVTQEDYRGILIPKAEAMMTKGPIKMLYVIGKEFTGYELEALWEDGTFGIKHWREFTRGVCARVPARLEAGWAIPSVGRIPDDGQDTSSPWPAARLRLAWSFLGPKLGPAKERHMILTGRPAFLDPAGAELEIVARDPVVWLGAVVLAGIEQDGNGALKARAWSSLPAVSAKMTRWRAP